MSDRFDLNRFERLPAPVCPVQVGPVCGFEQTNPRAQLPAVLRSRLISFLKKWPDWDGVVALAGEGVHHWVHISAGEAVSMMGFVTPRLIADHSGAAMPDETALNDTLSRPERLAAHIRSAELSGDGAALTGHLIGAEMAAARMYWLGQQMALIGDAPSPYEAALLAQGVSVTVASL